MNVERKGLFISLEGPDGSGKSTNLSYVKSLFSNRDLNTYTFRDPGGSAISEEIRDLLLKERAGAEQLHKETELLLFCASRMQLVKTKIDPLLNVENNVVITDRFLDSTYAYQGVGDGLTSEVLSLEASLFGNYIPDATIFFDISLEESLRRINARQKEYNQLNARDIEFRKKTFKGYQERFKNNHERMYRIDATASLEAVQEQLEVVVEQILNHHS